MKSLERNSRKNTRSRFIVGAILLASFYYVFVDSHSVVNRIRWSHEYRQLKAEHDSLKQRIAIAEETLERSGSIEFVEEMARTRYQYLAPGETRHRIVVGEKPRDVSSP